VRSHDPWLVLSTGMGIPTNLVNLLGCKMADETKVPDPEDDIDGCDCPIEETDATPDEDLPAAVGGVA